MARTVMDGVFDQREYNNVPVKIVWVLKEALEYGQDSQSKLLDDALANKQLGPTWTPIAYVAHAIIAGWENGNFTEWKDIPSVESGVGEVLKKIAIVNVNKIPNRTQSGYSNNSVIWNAYLRFSELIESQINDLNPDIVVFGYPKALVGIVHDVFRKMTGQEYRIDEHFGTFAVTVIGKRLFIWAYHPCYYRSEEAGVHSQHCYYNSFIDSVKFYKRKHNEQSI